MYEKYFVLFNRLFLLKESADGKWTITRNLPDGTSESYTCSFHFGPFIHHKMNPALGFIIMIGKWQLTWAKLK